MKIKQFTNLLGISTSLKIAAASSLAIGFAAIIPAESVKAVVLNSGQLVFQDGTTNFFEGVNPVAGDTFAVQFNPGSLAFVTDASESFSGSFPVIPLAYTITPSALATFAFDAVNAPNTFDYRLTSGNLAFTFTNGVNLTVANNSLFRGSFNAATRGVDFGVIDSTGSFFSNADGLVPTATLAFSFGDIPGGNSGGYSIAASPVPEPFTIIGTIIGGTAAFRMRKKLASSNKN
ncbi:PEP-CTERM sorting domain-containing protein [Chamaesiphon minutus]|uniref:PEP-CTERM putative exosortase interaction domain-containing protein n=1 Tax=Chamaesiphon minutus (strain ATCC 27169 / PCC 6605) TaxID=1173020 RepID=K9UKW6_CHAP6|nr:PEP-CTERM sorting domain-containing protein [Chamaesiphon minutus]AFY95106.1 PEP-CTERM putative exosortase interaction domain-containing protein [Chamaesiphon minutus PCC 6605]